MNNNKTSTRFDYEKDSELNNILKMLNNKQPNKKQVNKKLYTFVYIISYYYYVIL